MWTNIPKPTTNNWISHNPTGKTQYDESDVEYDDASMFYDGINPAQWTDIAKPSTSNWTNVNKPT